MAKIRIRGTVQFPDPWKLIYQDKADIVITLNEGDGYCFIYIEDTVDIHINQLLTDAKGIPRGGSIKHFHTFYCEGSGEENLATLLEALPKDGSWEYVDLRT
jgi:hypothetical protein